MVLWKGLEDHPPMGWAHAGENLGWSGISHLTLYSPEPIKPTWKYQMPGQEHHLLTIGMPRMKAQGAHGLCSLTAKTLLENWQMKGSWYCLCSYGACHVGAPLQGKVPIQEDRILRLGRQAL